MKSFSPLVYDSIDFYLLEQTPVADRYLLKRWDYTSGLITFGVVVAGGANNSFLSTIYLC